MSLKVALSEFFSHYGTDRQYWVAYSGGLDSHVLLANCVALRKNLSLKLQAIHVNHGWSKKATQWAQHCRKICDDFELQLVERTINITPDNITPDTPDNITPENVKPEKLKPVLGLSIEALARDQRYALFAECLAAGDVLLTAHHQDDQAETIFLQLLRGAGLKGLAAMPLFKPFAKGFHGRPFLYISRKQLEHDAHATQLNWVEDESNKNCQLRRNFLRHQVMPMLTEHWPSMGSVLSRSARHCAEAQHLLDEFAQELLEKVQGSVAHTLSVSKLLDYSIDKQKLMLRRWIQLQECLLPDVKKLDTILTNVLSARVDSVPCVMWSNVQIRRYQDNIYLLKNFQKTTPKQLKQRLFWDFSDPLHLPGVGQLSARKQRGKGLTLDIKNVMVSFRQGGEMLSVKNCGNKMLKKLFQEWKVCPWERNHLPLISTPDRLIAVVGYYIHPDFLAKPGGMGYELMFERK